MAWSYRWLSGLSLLLTACLAPRAPGMVPPPVSTATATVAVSLPTPTPTTRPAAPTVTLIATPSTAPSPTPTSAPLTPPAAPTATALPVTVPLSAAPPQTYETTVTLLTYGYEAGFQPTAPTDPCYPYPRLDFSQIGPPAPRVYRALVLENELVSLTVLPELGGRLYRWQDKTTGRELLYQNPVVKPTGWGYRGWWLAAGGVEWAFPVEEHGLNEWRPWQSEWLAGPDWRGIRVWDTDERTGLQVEVTLLLSAGRSDLVLRPRLSNPTGVAQPFQFWSNAMLTVGGGLGPPPTLRFWLPTDQVILHSTGDGTLPAPGELLTWPLDNGRDFSQYAGWHSYLGLFAAQARGAVGLYDESLDQGLVRTYPPAVARGVKVFGLGDLPAALYTDGESRYLELWGGYTRTFWDYATLPAGSSVTWEERWYPVSGIGGLSWANAQLAAGLTPGGEGVIVGVTAPAPLPLQLKLRRDSTPVAEWNVTVGPAVPFRQFVGGSGGWQLELWQAGTLVARLP